MARFDDRTIDPTVRAPDTGLPLLDNDGEPIRELVPDNVDQLLDHGATLSELAAAERSWRFGHVIVDEAQDLTPMQWRMVARRARGNSMTIVGDLAQRSVGEPGDWSEHLPESIGDWDYQELTVNYRSPAEVGDLSAAILGELAPSLSPSTAIREVGHRPRAIPVHDVACELPMLLAAATVDIGTGRLAVIGAHDDERCEIDGVVWLDPWQAKGLEFDSVVVIEPARIAALDHGLSLLYVAVTRTTDRLALVHAEPLPSVLAEVLEPTQ